MSNERYWLPKSVLKPGMVLTDSKVSGIYIYLGKDVVFIDGSVLRFYPSRSSICTQDETKKWWVDIDMNVKSEDFYHEAFKTEANPCKCGRCVLKDIE